jgi:hypothetical protein
MALSVQDAQRYLNARAEHKCQVCGNSDFSLVANNEVAVLPKPMMTGRVLPVVATFCLNCGAVQEFVAHIMEEWIKANAP